MEILLAIALIFSVFAVCAFITEVFDNNLSAGLAAAALYVLIVLTGIALLQKNAEVGLATDICYAEVTADEGWQSLSVPALRAAADAAVPAAHMSPYAAADAAEACYMRLQTAAAD